MRKFVLGTAMVLSLAFAASVAFAVPLSVNVPWYINDAAGAQAVNFDTWVQVKNKTAGDLTFYVDYYDNDNWYVVATTDTFTLVSQASEAYYTGKASRDFSMGTGAEKGTVTFRWEGVGPAASDDISGYYTTIRWDTGYAFGVNFDY